MFEREDGSTFQLSRVDGHQHKRGQRGFVRGELESDYERGIDVGEPVAGAGGARRDTWQTAGTCRPGDRQAGERHPAERSSGSVSEAGKAARDELDFVSLLRARGTTCKAAVRGRRRAGCGVQRRVQRAW